jgi:hypothetical protein
LNQSHRAGLSIEWDNVFENILKPWNDILKYDNWFYHIEQ